MFLEQVSNGIIAVNNLQQWQKSISRQTFGHTSDGNGRVKVNGCNTVRDYNFNTI